MDIKKIKTRTYLVSDDGEKVKMIPKAYQDIEPSIVSSCLTDLKKVSLNAKERFNLELHLFRENLKSEDKYVYELIKKAKPVEALEVNVKFLEFPRTELKFSNGHRVKCHAALFSLFGSKRTYLVIIKPID